MEFEQEVRELSTSRRNDNVREHCSASAVAIAFLAKLRINVSNNSSKRQFFKLC